QGLNVLVVDADPQGSTLRWSEVAEWDVPTLALPVKNLHNRLPGITSTTTDVVLIDTPPLDEQAGIVYSALRAADTILVPVAPTIAEVERLPDVWAAIEEVEPLRASPAQVAVLLNRSLPRANSTEITRNQIESTGHHVLATSIPRREMYAQALASPITDLGAYANVAAELDALGERA